MDSGFHALDSGFQSLSHICWIPDFFTSGDSMVKPMAEVELHTALGRTYRNLLHFLLHEATEYR